MLLCLSSMISMSPSGLLLCPFILFVFFSFEIMKNHVVVFSFLPCLFNSRVENSSVSFSFPFPSCWCFQETRSVCLVVLTACIHLIVFFKARLSFCWHRCFLIGIIDYFPLHQCRFILLVSSVFSGAKYDYLNIGVCWSMHCKLSFDFYWCRRIYVKYKFQEFIF